MWCYSAATFHYISLASVFMGMCGLLGIWHVGMLVEGLWFTGERLVQYSWFKDYGIVYECFRLVAVWLLFTPL